VTKKAYPTIMDSKAQLKQFWKKALNYLCYVNFFYGKSFKIKQFVIKVKSNNEEFIFIGRICNFQFILGRYLKNALAFF
jgi:mRNA deadenylase 3'-5' endonuclease subunit Ccr4